MPVNDGRGVMPGEICRGCIRLIPEDKIIEVCPWGNSSYPNQTTMFLGDDRIVGNVCHSYISYSEIEMAASSNNDMIKKAANMNDLQLKTSLYRKIMALPVKERNKMYQYWDYLLPSEYAAEMVDDTIGTAPRQKDKKEDKKKDKKKEQNKFYDGFKEKKEKHHDSHSR